MPHPVETKIAALRQQARRLLTLYALGWTVACVVAVVLVLSLTDYVIRFQDHGVRLIASLTVILVAAWAGYQYLYRSTRRQLRDVEMARQVERQFPKLADRLSSTVEFLHQREDDHEAGSAALRRAVITQTTDDVEQLDFSGVLERRPARRALAAAGGVLAVSLILALINPLAAGLAIARLARPLGSDAWPRSNNLALRSRPERIASGQTFEVEIIDQQGRRLPETVRMHFRYQTESQTTEEVEPMQMLDGMMVVRKENVSRPFEYRAEGGDDQSMPWTKLEVVEPPRVESLKIVLQPPAYTGWPAEDSDRHIQALRGTRVEFKASTSKRLKSVALHQENGPAVSGVLSSEGYDFVVGRDAAEPFVIDKSGSYWFELEDSEGLVGGQTDRWEIRALTDQPPSVSIEQPTGNLFITADAAVRLRILAKDDLALQDVSLHFSRSDRSDVEDFEVPLLTGPKSVERLKSGARSGQLAQGDSRVVEHVWELAPLKLAPGVQINFFAAASDYLPQVGKSMARRLTIITPQELEDRIAQRQALILAELARVLKMQQDSRSQTTSLEIQMRSVGQLNKQDIDHAQGAELNQRQVARTLTSESEGVPAQVRDLLADLENNKLDSPDVERRMRAIQEELGRLGDEHLNVIERELTGAIKGAQAHLNEDGKQPAAENAQVGKSLTAAGEHQDKVVESLENVIRDLGQWDNYRRFARDVGQVQREQQDIEQRTKELGLKTLTKDLKDLDPQQQADLKKLARQQQDLSRRFDKIQQQMDEAEKRLQESDPLAAATISDALHQSRQQGASGLMRQASNHVDNNQVGQAAKAQAQATQALQEMLDILANRREVELARLVKKLREAESDLSELRKKQAGLQKKMAEAKADESPEGKQKLERLAREQRELEKEAERMSRRLERLQASKASKTTGNAAAKMSKSGQAGEQGDGETAEGEAERAEKDIEEAEQQLAERRRQAEADLAREQLARMEDTLKALRQRQQEVVGETERLEGLRKQAGQFTRAQIGSVRQVGREQQALRDETRALGEKIAAAEVFRLALDSAAGAMNRAADLLDRQQTGEPTIKAEKLALAKFNQLLDALAQGKPKKPSDGDKGGQGGDGKQGGAEDGIRKLAEVKLLKLLQEDLNERFGSLTEPSDEPAADREQQLALLSKEQGRLAELAEKLAQPPAEQNPEDDPDKLPDLRKNNNPAEPEPGNIQPREEE